MAKLQHIDTMINLLIDGWLRTGENLVKGLLMAGGFSPAGQCLRALVLRSSRYGAAVIRAVGGVVVKPEMGGSLLPSLRMANSGMAFVKKFLSAVLLKAVLVLMLAASGTVLSAHFSSEASAAVVNRIEVRGNARMDADTIITYLTIQPGQQFNSQDIDDSVKALFATGLFTDVAISQSGSTLIVEVDESGIVNAVFFEGNKRLKDEALSSIVQTAPRSTFSEEKVLSDVDRISEAYSRVGREDATVSYEIVPLQNKRVNVIYRINEGEKTKISRIDFVGNSAYAGFRLRDIMDTKPTNILSWLRNDDIYDPDKLRSDEEKLRRFYYDHGYADFQIISSDVAFDETANAYTITITVEEGPVYKFGNITIDSTIAEVSADTLYPLVETVQGKNYSARRVEETVISLSKAIAERGFAFAQVNPRGNRNFDTNTIDVTYQIDQGPRVYIEAINIVGNDRTRDHVIRREFDISEGDPLNQVMIQRTKRRLEGLGFFESVEISTRQGSTPDRVVVVVRVVDKATGEFAIGGGFSTAQGALGEISFSERNFLGRGQYIKVAAGFGQDDQRYSLSFTEPYFLGYRIAAGFDIWQESTDANSNRQYGTDTLGGVLRLGIPITEKLNSRVFYTYSSQDYNADSKRIEINDYYDLDPIQGNNPNELSAALANLNSWTRSGVGYTLTYNGLDNSRLPTDGWYAQLMQTLYGLGGDATYLQTEGILMNYTTLSEEFDIIGMARIRGGVKWNYGDESGYRTQENYFQGSRDIRGFDAYGFGPRDPVTGDALGGMYFWNGTVEMNFPLPGVPESIGLRGALFSDFGQLWNVNQGGIDAILASNPGVSTEEIDDNTLRASVGGSIIWSSPFGPLRFDYAVPVSSTSWDDIREFNFGVYTAF
jgi:outer membrane protein insertion porin family